VVDSSEALSDSDREIAALIGRKPTLLILNKVDLPQNQVPDNAFLPAAPRVPLSALTGAGLDQLESIIVEQIAGGRVITPDSPIVSNPRHKALLTQAIGHVRNAIEAQEAGLSPDLVSIDVREAVDALGEITGETATEDLLNTIFSRFCIGK
jgi:tRNA modification GTPase